VLRWYLDLSKWVSSSGSGNSVPITALLRGSGPNGESIDLEIDYQSFFEVTENISKITQKEFTNCDYRQSNE